jgi:hypothetical protein
MTSRSLPVIRAPKRLACTSTWRQQSSANVSMPRQSHSMLPFVPSLNRLWARRFLMTSQAQRTQPALRWQMPIIPGHYDRSTLSPEEWLALEQYTTIRAGASKATGSLQSAAH